MCSETFAYVVYYPSFPNKSRLEIQCYNVIGFCGATVGRGFCGVTIGYISYGYAAGHISCGDTAKHIFYGATVGHTYYGDATGHTYWEDTTGHISYGTAAGHTSCEDTAGFHPFLNILPLKLSIFISNIKYFNTPFPTSALNLSDTLAIL